MTGRSRPRAPSPPNERDGPSGAAVTRGRRRWGWVAAAAVAAACAASRGRPVDLAAGRRVHEPRDYPRVLRLWTRHGKILREFDTAADLFATYASWDLRWARAVRFISLYRLPESERGAIHWREAQAWRAAHELHLSVATSRAEWNDFTRKGSIWRVTLIDDRGREAEPTELRADRSPRAEKEAFYPHAPLFSEHYVVRFPRRLADGSTFVGEDAARFVLRVASPLGTADLMWETIHAPR